MPPINKNIKQGKYRIVNQDKYLGSISAKSKELALYRSSWELIAFVYLDLNPDVVRWGSEIIRVPYKLDIDIHKGVNKVRNYYVDLYYETTNGNKYLIEIKPNAEKYMPKTPKKKTIWYYKSVAEYVKNRNKWNYATAFAKERGLIFEIWSEDQINTLKSFVIYNRN